MFLCVVGLTLGCAHSHDKFYYTDGSICAEVRSWVLGTGETEKYIVNEWCDVIVIYDTKDTGISENVGKLAEGLAKGAVKGVVPVP